jgi:hypothetical protein
MAPEIPCKALIFPGFAIFWPPLVRPERRLSLPPAQGENALFSQGS